MKLNTCEQHDDCIVVYLCSRYTTCPICKLQTEKDELEEFKEYKNNE